MLRFLARENAGQLRAADRAGTLQSRFTILHSNLVRILHIPLFFALYAICYICHSAFIS
jgi:hypothetical protein